MLSWLYPYKRSNLKKYLANRPRSKKSIYGFLRTDKTSLGQVQDCCKSGKYERKYFWKHSGTLVCHLLPDLLDTKVVWGSNPSKGELCLCVKFLTYLKNSLYLTRLKLWKSFKNYKTIKMVIFVGHPFCFCKSPGLMNWWVSGWVEGCKSRLKDWYQ